MKRLFGVVLALNIALLVSILFFDPPSSSRHPATRPGNHSDHTLLLLSERPNKLPASSVRGSSPKKPSGSIAAEAPATREPVSEERVCYTLGPFPRPEDAVGAVMQLKARDLDARARKKDEAAQAGFLTFIAPLKTRAEARAILRTLHQQGIDSFIVTQGDKNNAISVGIYSELEQAQARQVELRKKGFQVLVEPRGTVKQEHWVDVMGEKGANVVAEIEKSLATDFASLRLERKDCR